MKHVLDDSPVILYIILLNFVLKYDMHAYCYIYDHGNNVALFVFFYNNSSGIKTWCFMFSWILIPSVPAYSAFARILIVMYTESATIRFIIIFIHLFYKVILA